MDKKKKQTHVKQKTGRKSKYETHVKPYLKRIPNWRRNGMSEEQVAKKLGVGYSTLSTYKNLFPEFLEAIKKGKEELVEELESSLYKSAKGYWITEEVTEVEEGTMGSKTKTKQHKKWIPASVGSLVFALKNLEKDKWKDNPESVEAEKGRGINLNLSGLPVKKFVEEGEGDE